MKAFYIIILVFFIMVGGIMTNRARVNNFTDGTIEKLSDLETAEAQVKKFTDGMLSELEKLEFSISRKTVNQVRDYARLLATQCKLNAVTDFETTRELLIAELEKIKDAESISFSSVF